MKLSVEIPLAGPALDALASAVAARLLESMDAKSPPSGIPYLTTAEAAEYLRCKPQRIYDLVSMRQLPVLKEGKRSLFRREHLDALVTEPE